MLNKLFRPIPNLVPVLLLAACSIWSLPSLAAEEIGVEVFHHFTPEPRRAGGGGHPRAGVILGPDGNLYGTAEVGGKYGKGTIYVTQPDGSTRILHSFRGGDGAYPRSELTLLGDVLYGSTRGSEYGGAKRREGVLFKYDKASGFTVLHTFDFDNEGRLPSTLILASDGNFYGTLERGPTGSYGALFRMTPAGEVKILHNFSASGLHSPTGTLLQGNDGALYGTASSYYPRDRPGTFVRGAVYRFSLKGQMSIVHAFAENRGPYDDGIDPDSGVILGSDGALHGLTQYGGAFEGGTFFKVNEDGSNFTRLASLPRKGFSGTNPLILARDGNYYGAEQRGEYFGPGRLIRLSADGAYTVLYTFPPEPGQPMGNIPLARLLQTHDGRLYGTALTGGSTDEGTLFRTSEPVDAATN